MKVINQLIYFTMKRVLFFIPVCLLCLFVSCEVEIDNYAEPSETLTGSVIDAITGQPILSEQPNGFQIRYKEIGYSVDSPDQFFWGKADGTFNNSKLFANTYDVTPVNGPFIQPETKRVDIKGVNKIEFTVTPYLNVTNPNCLLSGDVLTVTFKISRPDAVTSKLNNAFVAIDWNPNVGNAVNKTKQTINYSSIDDKSVLGATQTVTINLANVGIKKGYKYYVRIGACTNANNSRYNYSTRMEFDY
jgi:hypothetical protein